MHQTCNSQCVQRVIFVAASSLPSKILPFAALPLSSLADHLFALLLFRSECQLSLLRVLSHALHGARENGATDGSTRTAMDSILTSAASRAAASDRPAAAPRTRRLQTYRARKVKSLSLEMSTTVSRCLPLPAPVSFTVSHCLSLPLAFARGLSLSFTALPMSLTVPTVSRCHSLSLSVAPPSSTTSTVSRCLSLSFTTGTATRNGLTKPRNHQHPSTATTHKSCERSEITISRCQHTALAENCGGSREDECVGCPRLLMPELPADM